MSLKSFWVDLGERAGKTFLQSFAAISGIGAIGAAAATSLVSIPWTTALEGAGLATLASVITSLLSAGVTNNATASAVLPADTSAIPDPPVPTE